MAQFHCVMLYHKDYKHNIDYRTLHKALHNPIIESKWIKSNLLHLLPQKNT